MNTDREPRAGRVALPGAGDPARDPAIGGPAARGTGVHRARRMSNWTAAALLAGAGAAAVALGHSALPVAAAHPGGSGTGGTAVPAGSPGTAGAGGPRVSHSVITSSGSGVTSTVTRTPGGKIVVTHTAAGQDN